MINLNAWFQKHGLCAENILYIYRKDRKTVIQRTDGAEFALFVPVTQCSIYFAGEEFFEYQQGNCRMPQPHCKYQQRWRLYHVGRPHFSRA